MKTFSVGLIGYGLGGQVFHAPMISVTEGLHLSVIRTSNPEDIRLAGQRYPQALIVKTSEELIMDEDLDVVVISIPNHLHFSTARSALLAGKHVVLDKPFTVTAAEAEKLITLSKKVGKTLTVFHNRRWDSDFLTVKKLLHSGKLGKIVEMEIHFDRFRPIPKTGWKESETPGNGIHYDLGSHLIDQALQLFGKPGEVMGDIRTQRSKAKTEDYFEITLFYDQLKVILKAGNLVKAPLPHFIVHGEKGSFVKYGMDIQESQLREGIFPRENHAWGEEPAEIAGTLYLENGPESGEKVLSENGDYRLFYQNLADVLNGKTSLEVKPEQALLVIQIIELAEKSHREKRILPVA